MVFSKHYLGFLEILIFCHFISPQSSNFEYFSDFSQIWKSGHRPPILELKKKSISLSSPSMYASNEPSTTSLSSSKPKLEGFSYFGTVIPKYGNSAPDPRLSEKKFILILLYSACPYVSNEPSMTFISWFLTILWIYSHFCHSGHTVHGEKFLSKTPEF